MIHLQKPHILRWGWGLTYWGWGLCFKVWHSIDDLRIFWGFWEILKKHQINFEDNQATRWCVILLYSCHYSSIPNNYPMHCSGGGAVLAQMARTCPFFWQNLEIWINRDKCTANYCSESAVEWLQFHFSYSDPLHTVSHCTPLQWINVTIAVISTYHDLEWMQLENCVLKI